MNNKFVGRDKFDFMAYGFAKLSNGYIFDYYYYEKHEKTLNGSPRLLITDDNFKTKNEFLPIDNDFCLLRKKTDISKNDKVLTYHAYGMDYVLVSNVLNINEYTIYKFDFKDRKIPSDKRLDAKSCISDKYDYLHDGIFSSKDYMVGTVGVKDVFVIDVNSGKIYTNGETGTFMDLLNKDCRYIYDNYFSVPISMKDNDIVSYLTGEIFQSYDKIQKQNISDDISKHLKADPSNIVLVLQRLSSKNEMR